MTEVLSPVDRDRPDVFPTRQQAVVRNLLEAQAAEDPRRPFALFPDGTSWDRATIAEEAWSLGTGLQQLGVKQGDVVLVWLPNGPDSLRAMLGIAALGCVYAPLNTAYRGALLAHAVNLSGSAVVIAHHQLVDRLQGLDMPKLKQVIVVGGEAPASFGPDILGAEVLRGERSVPPSLRSAIEPWHPFAIVYTSGTTGLSKGVLQSYVLYDAYCKVMYRGYDERDRYFAYLPFFHTGGISTVYGMMQRRGSVAVRDGFSVATYWEEVQRFGVTGACIMGSMGGALSKRPPGPHDTDHGLRLAVMAPMVPDVDAFRERFNVEIFTEYGTTEVGTPLRSGSDVTEASSCGEVAGGYEARVIDSNDLPVAPGKVGELAIRHQWPWAIATEYVGMPEATALAWRNGWFHTGDTFTVDEAGVYRFVDRRTDVIRRRGENISSIEVERELLVHPDIVEAAAVGVPDPTGEEEVKAIVVVRDGQELAPEALVEFLRQRMAHYMVPRYFEFVASLPRTATEKVQKSNLRAQGVTATTWDRELAGIRLRRDVLT
jgi:crotonobetaine/carnitine-CoA ligase